MELCMRSVTRKRNIFNDQSSACLDPKRARKNIVFETASGLLGLSFMTSGYRLQTAKDVAFKSLSLIELTRNILTRLIP